MKFKFKNALLAFAALAMVGGVGAGVALGHAGEAVETRAAEGDTHTDTSVAFSKLLNNNATIDDVAISEPSYSVAKISINVRYNKTLGGVTITPTIGGTQLAPKTHNANSTVDLEWTLSPAVKGAIVFSFINNCGSGTGKGTFYFNSVTLTEGPGDAPVQTTFSVTYDGNGATSGSTSDDTEYESGDQVTVLASGFAREFYQFAEWNTKADGSGDAYDAGDTFSISKDTTLYAQWDFAETELDDGAYTATLGYKNPIPSALNVKGNTDETLGLVEVSASYVSYKDNYKEYALAKIANGPGKITFTNHTNAKFTKIVLDAYKYDNYTVKGDGVDAHVGENAVGDEHNLIEVDLDAQNTITVETNNSYDANLFGATLYMKAGNEEIHVTGVSLNVEAGDVYIGKTRQLTASVLPLDADNRSVSWSSSDEGVATVDDAGLVTGVAEGVATITATTVDGGFEATFEANVKEVFYGSVTNPLTPEQAFEVLQIADTAISAEPLCVRGVVGASKYNEANANWEIWLKSSDGTNVKFFELYRTVFDEEAVLEDIYQQKDALIGLTVTASGYGKMYSGTPELSFENSVAPVISAVAFSAHTFADGIIMLTKDLCDAYEDESAYAARRSALLDIWESLEAKYGTLPAADVDIIANADADEEGTLIEQAMARYDYLTGKYELDNFITGRTPVSLGRVPHASVSAQHGSMIAVLVILISVSALATGGFVLARKKRKN